MQFFFQRGALLTEREIKFQSCNSLLNKICLVSFKAQMAKHLPTVRETWVQSLDGEDLLEKGMAIHCSILAWRILMDRGA